MLSDDVVDVAVSHAPETEARALREEPTWAYRKFAYNDKAARFAEWLTRGEGRRRVGDFRVHGRPAFTLWPGGCPDEQPQNFPCRAASK